MLNKLQSKNIQPNRLKKIDYYSLKPFFSEGITYPRKNGLREYKSEILIKRFIPLYFVNFLISYIN